MTPFTRRPARLAVLLVAPLVWLGGCIAHEKVGDAAAASGDWRGAYEEYGQAIRDGEKSPPLSAKFETARVQALQDATAKGRSCADAQDWPCALEAAQFAVHADPGNPDREAFRRLAATRVAVLWVGSARAESAQGRFPHAAELLGKALVLSDDPEVSAAASAAKIDLLQRLDATVQQLRSREAYPDAVSLLELAARLDEGHQGALVQLQHERADWQARVAQRLAQEGDGAVHLRRFTEGCAKYRESLSLQDDPRVTARLRYATLLETAENALAQGNPQVAVVSFREAAMSGLDGDGYAGARLRSVRIPPPAYVGQNAPPYAGQNDGPYAAQNGPPRPDPYGPPPGDAPAGVRHPWRTWLTDVSVRLSQADCAFPPRASSFVELEQTGRSVYRGTPQPSLEGRWHPEDVNLSPTERVRVRVWEVASGHPRLVLDTWAAPESLTNGAFEATSPGGTWLQLRFSQPVRVGALR